MGITIDAAPIWLGGAYSNLEFVQGQTAAVPDVARAQICGDGCTNFVCVQAFSPEINVWIAVSEESVSLSKGSLGEKNQVDY